MSLVPRGYVNFFESYNFLSRDIFSTTPTLPPFCTQFPRLGLLRYPVILESGNAAFFKGVILVNMCTGVNGIHLETLFTIQRWIDHDCMTTLISAGVKQNWHERPSASLLKKVKFFVWQKRVFQFCIERWSFNQNDLRLQLHLSFFLRNDFYNTFYLVLRPPPLNSVFLKTFFASKKLTIQMFRKSTISWSFGQKNRGNKPQILWINLKFTTIRVSIILKIKYILNPLYINTFHAQEAIFNWPSFLKEETFFHAWL